MNPNEFIDNTSLKEFSVSKELPNTIGMINVEMSISLCDLNLFHGLVSLKIMFNVNGFGKLESGSILLK
jgi:hypothetical protein